MWVWWLSACTRNDNLLTPPVSNLANNQITSTPTPTLTAIYLEQDIVEVHPVQNISDDRIFDVWWLLDSSNLIYTTDKGTWTYDLSKNESIEKALSNTSHITPRSDIPSNAHTVSYSPSGDQVLYLTLTSVPYTPTPANSIGDVGEYNLSGVMAELWVLNDTGARIVGEIEYCGIENYLWSKDELNIVIVAPTLPAPCSQAHAWHVNLENNVIQPLFPKEKFQGILPIYNISPDGKFLMYGIPSNSDDGASINPLFILDLEMLTSTPLATPAFSKGVGWLDDRTLLIEYRKQSESPLTLGFFDLKNSELTDVASQFEGLWIRFIKLSPDRKWLAFATGEDFYYMDNLWLMEINDSR